MSYARYYRFFATLTLVVGLVLASIPFKLTALARIRANHPDWKSTAMADPVNTPDPSSEGSPSAPDAATKARVVESFGKLPLSFEANQGQTDQRVKFLTRGKGYTLFLTSAEAVFALSMPEVEKSAKDSSKARDAQAAVLRMSLAGANSKPHVEGVAQLPGISNYLIGNDPNKWRTNIPNYSKVQYSKVYPGVNLVYYGNQQQLEYDFVVAPGADPKRIKMNFAGAQKMRIDANGDLVLHTMAGEFRQFKPIIYQDVNGIRQEVAGRYVRTGKRQVGFELGAYDPNHPLVIDPATNTFTTFLGGSGTDIGNAIAVDSDGVYITGTTNSGTFPVAPSGPPCTAYQCNKGTGYDAFVTKLNTSGTSLTYSTFIGGSGTDSGNGIAVKSGAAYIVGATSSTNFPVPTSAAQNANGGGANDAFVFKLDSTGTARSYATYLGGSGDDQGFGIAVDSFANAFITGKTDSSDFPTQSSSQGTKSGLSTYDVFVAKYLSSGGLGYAIYIGGTGSESGYAIALTGSTPYITGDTTSTDFPTTSGVYQTSNNGSADAFVTKVGIIGSNYGATVSTYLGGSSDDHGYGIAFSTNVYVAGYTSSSDFSTTRAFQSSLSGSIDGFVTVLNSALTAIPAAGYSTYLGGSSSDKAFAIAVGSSGNVFVTGETNSTNFYNTSGFQTSNAGNYDAFVTKIAPPSGGGNATISYSSYIGGSADDNGNGIAVDSSGNAYVTGETNSTETTFPYTSGVVQAVNNGGADAFVTKVAP